MKYKRSLFSRVTIDGWKICKLVRETNFVKRNMKSNLYDVLPDGTLMSTDAVFYLSAKTSILTNFETTR